MFLLTATKKGFSSKEIQKQLGLKRYEPVGAMVHKLRKAMGNKDARYTLEGMIEFDECYFTIESSEIEQEKGIRGRGAVGKSNVAIMAESTPLEDIETGKKSNQCRYFKAKVLTNHTSGQINETIQESISEKSILFSDKSTSYIDIADFVEMHITEKDDLQTINIVTATYTNAYVIQVIFSDAVEKTIDFQPFISKSQHPSISKYLNLNNFKNFAIIDGNLN